MRPIHAGPGVMQEKSVENEDACEEEAPDWRLLSNYAKTLGAQKTTGNVEPFIPRRGEKDFEPTEAMANAQAKALTESRQALFAALSAGIRGHSSRDHVRCIWTRCKKMNLSAHQWNAGGMDQPYVDGIAKGVLFSSIGRWSRERKRLELNPEELLYLIERGTVECWTAEDQVSGYGSIPLSVQQAWAEIIGSGELSLERYQVYAYLKRLGYIVLRKELVDTIWRSTARRTPSTTVLSTMMPSLRHFYSFASQPFIRLTSWICQFWRFNRKSWIAKRLETFPFLNRSLVYQGIWRTYDSIFQAIRLIPSGPKIYLPANASPSELSRRAINYEVFYYVYKPNQRFAKACPPTPDFQICVVDSETMLIPDIYRTNTLLDTVQGPLAPSYPTVEKNPHFETTLDRSCAPPRSLLHCLMYLLSFGYFGKPVKSKKPVRQNIYAKLKRGERNVLLAVVDHGIISFLKFSETDFGGTPLVGSPSH